MDGLAVVVVVVVVVAGEGQVQGDCVFLLSQIGAGGGRGRPDAALPEEDEEKKRRDHAFDVFRVSNQTFELNRLTTCLERGSNSRP